MKEQVITSKSTNNFGAIRKCYMCKEVLTTDNCCYNKRRNRTGTLVTQVMGVCSQCKSEYKRLKHRHRVMNNPQIVASAKRRAILKRKYNITMGMYEDLEMYSDGKCYICGVKPELKHKHDRLVVDHNHKDGTIRGLLCNNCNLAIGNFRDNVEFMENAIEYIKRNGFNVFNYKKGDVNV